MQNWLGNMLLFGCFGLLQITHAQSIPNPGVDEAVRFWREQSKGSHTYLVEQGTRLKALATATNNCDTLRVAHALLLHAHLDEPEAIERPEFDSLNCPFEGFEMMREEGVYEFMFGDLVRAKRWFERCLPLTEDPKALSSLAQSIGTCHYLNNELKEAVRWYEASTEYGIELLSAISIMNLASVSMALGDGHSGLKWAEAAEARVLQQLDEGMDSETFVLQRDIILLNQSLAHLELGQTDDAIAAYDRLKLDDFLPGVAMEFYHLAVALAFAVDSPLPIERHQAVFSEHLIRDSLGAVARFGPTLLMLEPWKSQWHVVEETSPWHEIRELPKERLPELVEPGRMAESASRGKLPWGVALALGWFMGGAAAAWGVQRGKSQSGASTASLIASLRSAVMSGDSERARSVLDELLKRGPWRPLDLDAPLSAKETEVLIGIKDGERAKETAQRLGLSVKSIYMMRTELKRKLELSDNDSIEEWVTNQIP